MTTYKCNNWIFNPNNQEIIYSDGQVQQLPGRISICLHTFIESNGITITYDELLNKVWGTTHKDSSTISSVISELRKRIGCGKEGIKLLVTIPKKGYRFTGEVEVVSASGRALHIIETVEPGMISQQEDPQTAEVATKTGNVLLDSKELPSKSFEHKTASTSHNAKLYPVSKSIHFAKFIFFGLLVLLAGGITVFTFLKGKSLSEEFVKADSLPAVVMTNHENITYEEGIESDFDVSQDGHWLIYSHRNKVEPKARIFLKNLLTGHIQNLPVDDDSDYESPSFSDDLANIAFIKNTKQGCEVWLLDFTTLNLENAQSHKISECGMPKFWSTTGFSKNGDAVFFSRSNSLTEPFRVYRHDLRTGYERNLTAPTSSGRGDYSFAVSPNGKRLAIVRNLLWQNTSIQVKNLDDGSSRSLIELPYPLEHVDWYSDHEIIYVGEQWKLYLHDINNDQRVVLADIGQPIKFIVSAQQRIFANKGLNHNSVLWSIDTQSTAPYSLKKEVSSPYLDFSPTKGVDDDLYFLSNRTGVTQLWSRVGERYQRVFDVVLPKYLKSLHFSSEYNAFYGVSEKRLFRLDLTNGKLIWLSGSNSQIRNVSLSDANSLIYSEDDNEQWYIKSLDLTSLAVTDFQVNGFTGHQQAGDIYYTRYRKSGLWKFNIKAGSSVKLIDDFISTASSYWDVDDNKIYLTGDGRIKVYSLNNGKLLDDSLTINGFVKNIQCYGGATGCILDMNELAEIEIIEFKH